MSDVVVDATPEEDQACASSAERLPDVPENQESIADLMRVKLTVSDERGNLPTQSYVDFDEDNFTPYDYLFPPKLRKKLNIAIIHDEEDQEEARDMKVFIEDNVHLTFGRICFRPRVKLLEEVSLDIKVDALDLALEEADFLFLYITQKFCNRKWNEFQALASVKAILAGRKDTRCSLVCVHTDQSCSINLPAKLDNTKHIGYYEGKREQFKEDVSKYFFEISDRLLTERRALTLRRQKHADNEPHILDMMKSETCGDRSKHPHQKENVTETRQSSHDQSLNASKDRTKRPGKSTAPANVEERDSGAPGNDASRKPINPQPHYR